MLPNIRKPLINFVESKKNLSPRTHNALSLAAMATMFSWSGPEALYRLVTGKSKPAMSTEAGFGNGLIALGSIIVLFVQIFVFLLLLPFFGLSALAISLLAPAVIGGCVGYAIPKKIT